MTPRMFNAIRYDDDSGIATIRLHRPERLNAFTVEMARELAEAFDPAAADGAGRVGVATGEGRAFCAGADLPAGSGIFKHESLPLRPDGGIDYSSEAARDSGGRVSLRI